MASSASVQLLCNWCNEPINYKEFFYTTACGTLADVWPTGYIDFGSNQFSQVSSDKRLDFHEVCYPKLVSSVLERVYSG